MAKIAVEPREWRRDVLAQAAEEGGAEVTDISEAEGLIWVAPEMPDQIAEFIDKGKNLRWIQLPYAGIEPFLPYLDHEHIWTCGKGVYAEPVAEHALGLMLAGFRGLNLYARATSWQPPVGQNLLGAEVCILGGGGITEELLKLLAPWGCRVTVVRRHDRPMSEPNSVPTPVPPLAPTTATNSDTPGSSSVKVTTTSHLHEALATADAVVLALALTDETRGIIAEPELDAMPSHSWLVNVARGEHIVTDHLVSALQTNSIGGAALDVTDPEPLPDNHPLWHIPNCIITPHVGNTPEMGLVLLAKRVKENVYRFAHNQELLGPVNVDLKY